MLNEVKMNVGQIHQVLIPVAALAISGIVGLIVKIIFARIKKNEDESKEIKENYLERFEKVHEQANEHKEEILKSIAEIRIMLEREFVRKSGQ